MSLLSRGLATYPSCEAVFAFQVFVAVIVTELAFLSDFNVILLPAVNVNVSVGILAEIVSFLIFTLLNAFWLAWALSHLARSSASICLIVSSIWELRAVEVAFSFKVDYKLVISEITWVCLAAAKSLNFLPLFLISLPVAPLNKTILSLVEVLGPITAPSILVCATVQWGVLVDNASAIQIIKSPCSHF